MKEISPNLLRVIAVGNFDGVHTGHVKVLKAAVKAAEKTGLLPAAISFYPHPRDFFSGEGTVKRITSEETKSELIKATGIQEHFVLPFDAELASLTSDGFTGLLNEKFGCKTVVCGENFRFGKNAGYTADGLCASCAKYWMNAIIVPYSSGISSSLIREYVLSGNVTEAAELLGRPFSVSGTVLHGRHIGTEIGFPTVNLISEKGLLLPGFGVYETRVLCGNEIFKGLTNVGIAPTVSEDPRSVRTETFLLDTHEELYGKSIRVEFLRFIRSEKKFASLEKLKEQIEKDLQTVTR